MLTDEQLKIRRGLVTASKIPIIMGASPFKTRAQLLHEGTNPNTKGHMLPHQERGHRLEPVVANWLGEQLMSRYYGEPARGRFELHAGAQDSSAIESILGKGSVLIDDTVVHKDLPWAAATPDAYITPPASRSTLLIGEIKTSSERAGWYPDKVPHHIWMQVQWQLIVLKSWLGDSLTTIYVGALVASNFVLREVEYDPSFAEAAIPAARAFLDEQESYISQGKIYPLPNQSGDVTVVPAPQSVAQALSERSQLLDDKRRIEQRLEAVNAELAPHISPERHVKCAGRIYKMVKIQPRVDEAAYATALEEMVTEGRKATPDELKELRESLRQGSGYSYISSYREDRGR
jgi:hypothetical protein